MQAPPHIAEAFGRGGLPLAVLCRRHLYVVDGRPHQASWSYLRWEMIDGTPAVHPSDERPDRGTMAQLADLGVRLTHVELVVWSRQPDPSEARLLDVPEGGTVLAQRRIMHAGEEVVEVADVIVPGDRTELAFRVDLAS
jgi:GntR family transcriptional regulator